MKIFISRGDVILPWFTIKSVINFIHNDIRGYSLSAPIFISKIETI